MEVDDKQYEEIIITKSKDNSEARLVTVNEKKEVISIISDSEVIVKDGYEVKLVPAE